MLRMVTVAVRTPLALGSKVTWKVVLPAATTGEVGFAVTEKSAAFVPESVGLDSVRLAEPVF